MNNLIDGFIRSRKQRPDNAALDVNGNIFTYDEFDYIAGAIAITIKQHERRKGPFAALLAYRSVAAYAGALGILASGRGYLPLNPNFPPYRNLKMFLSSKTDILIVGHECLRELEDILPGLEASLLIILPDTSDTGSLRSRFPQHRFIDKEAVLKNRGSCSNSGVDTASCAYLLFTSGTTGAPKGIAISHNSVLSYLRYIGKRYEINQDDRFSQTFDMTFDLSVHDMFLCWNHGACLCPVPKASLMAPAKFIADSKLTIWFSVPSAAMFMSRMRMLLPNMFPHLRYSLFCGEPLSATLAMKWQEAAPRSILENLYGPTEATIAITHYRWDKKRSQAECLNGIVPIGHIFSGQKGCVVDQGHNLVPDGKIGELCLSGSQVTKGYLDDIEKTKKQFTTIPACGDALWYKTGDLVKKDANGCLYFIGRADDQVKILGHRVELQEIDALLRKAAECEMAASVAWPVEENNYKGIVAFICCDDASDETAIINYCKAALPDYMVPRKVYFIENMPMNSNGKTDRVKLVEMLKKGLIAQQENIDE